MQAKNLDGSFGPVKPFSEEGLLKEMAKPNVQHVEVFPGTPENIEQRTKLHLGVKNRSFKGPKNKR